MASGSKDGCQTMWFIDPELSIIRSTLGGTCAEKISSSPAEPETASPTTNAKLVNVVHISRFFIRFIKVEGADNVRPA